MSEGHSYRQCSALAVCWCTGWKIVCYCRGIIAEHRNLYPYCSLEGDDLWIDEAVRLSVTGGVIRYQMNFQIVYT